jgi:hypothetical protein
VEFQDKLASTRRNMEDHRHESAAVPVVLIPTMGRPVILDDFPEPTNEPRADLFRTHRHVRLLKTYRPHAWLPYGGVWWREVIVVTDLRFASRACG